MPKRIFSGVKPTGPLHLGNYLGALRNWVQLQHEYESFFCIVNLHAITIAQDPKELLSRTREIARLYVAVGIDPNVSAIFAQSDVPEHTELTWVLNCLTHISELDRMTQFKEKARTQRENTGVGLFDYPILMASDILLYKTNLVPVGEDQKQHLELTRDLAARFNRDYSQVFQIPEPFIPRVGSRIMSLSDPSKKMAKSDESPNGCVMLMDDPDTILNKFKRAVTDSETEIRFDDSRPGISNLLTIYHLITSREPDEIEEQFAGQGYAKLKRELAEVTIEFLRPLQKRYRQISDAELDGILEAGRVRASEIARDTMAQVRSAIGLRGAPSSKGAGRI